MYLMIKFKVLSLKFMGGPGRSRTACLFIANEAFNQVNFGPDSQKKSPPWMRGSYLPLKEDLHHT